MSENIKPRKMWAVTNGDKIECVECTKKEARYVTTSWNCSIFGLGEYKVNPVMVAPIEKERK